MRLFFFFNHQSCQFLTLSVLFENWFNCCWWPASCEAGDRMRAPLFPCCQLQRCFSLRDAMMINIITEPLSLVHFKRYLLQQEHGWRKGTGGSLLPPHLCGSEPPKKLRFPSGCRRVTQFVCCPLECAHGESGSAHMQRVVVALSARSCANTPCVSVCVCARAPERLKEERRGVDTAEKSRKSVKRVTHSICAESFINLVTDTSHCDGSGPVVTKTRSETANLSTRTGG